MIDSKHYCSCTLPMKAPYSISNRCTILNRKLVEWFLLRFWVRTNHIVNIFAYHITPIPLHLLYFPLLNYSRTQRFTVRFNRAHWCSRYAFLVISFFRHILIWLTERIRLHLFLAFVRVSEYLESLLVLFTINKR